MSQSDPHVVKTIVTVIAALSIGLGALVARVRAQDAQPGGEGAKPQAADAPTEGDVPAEPSSPEALPTEATSPATQPDTAAKFEYVEAVLAERLYELAQGRLREGNVTEPMWRQAAALLQAASRIAPKDPRFPRLLIEARLKVADREGAVAALSAYRKLDPADRIAQMQLIDLYAEQMQTADARLEYLRDVLSRESIPAEVRSHVAALCVPLLLERSQGEAEAMVEESLKLSPVNPEALRLKYDLLPDDAPPAARAAALMAMLRSNPAQPDVVTELAGVLAAGGLGKESLEWYSVALRLYPRSAMPFPPGFVADAGTQMLTSGQAPALDALLAAYLQARPGDADAWFVRLAKEKSAATQKLDRKVIDEAWNALGANLSEVCKAVAGGEAAAANSGQPAPAAPGAPPPTTRPAPATAADAMQAAKRIKAGEAQDLQPALIAALSDLAWLELYFGEDADAASNWVAALREVLPPDSVMLNRLDGWLDLVAGRAEQAKAKLAPIAQRDALAAIGMVRLAAKDAGGQAEADEAAKKLLSSYRTGLVGAMVWSALHDPRRKLADHPGAADLLAEVEKFPRDWMQILERPDAYYDLQADVMKVAHKYREPMFGRITLRNKTQYDLTIGPAGVIRPDLWIDAKISGLANRNFPGVAYERIARHVVLPAGQQLIQYVRVDQGALADSLDQNPSASAQINANLLVNPSPTPSGVGPGPAGQRKNFDKAFVRSGFALTQPVARRRLTAQIEGGSPGERIMGLDLLAAYIRVFARQKEPDAAMRALGAEFIATIATSREDPNKPVALWASYLTARLNPEQRAGVIDGLLADPGWPARLLGVLASVDLGPERLAEIAAKLAENDPEPTVKEFAAATVDFLRSQPATQPVADADAAPAQAREGAATPAGPGPSAPTTAAPTR